MAGLDDVCPSCGGTVPRNNLPLHSLRCRAIDPRKALRRPRSDPDEGRPARVRTARESADDGPPPTDRLGQATNTKQTRSAPEEIIAIPRSMLSGGGYGKGGGEGAERPAVGALAPAGCALEEKDSRHRAGGTPPSVEGVTGVGSEAQPLGLPPGLHPVGSPLGRVVCRVCTFDNVAGVGECEMCSTPLLAGAALAASIGTRTGDVAATGKAPPERAPSIELDEDFVEIVEEKVVDAPGVAAARVATRPDSDKRATRLFVREQSWHCTECTLANTLADKVCAMCGACRTAKPTSKARRRETIDGTSVDVATKVDAASIEDMHALQRSEAQLVDGLVAALKHCLAPLTTDQVRVSRETLFVSQRHVEGHGWACGYRNIQMLAAAVCAVPSLRSSMFLGDGVLPDLPSLQAWLQRAWSLGFDPQGAEQLGNNVIGTSKWIGAGECVALLRSFRVAAELIVFPDSTQCKVQGKALHRALLWLWDYFDTPLDDQSPLPVYLQYAGHSITVVGVQRRPRNAHAARKDRTQTTLPWGRRSVKTLATMIDEDNVSWFLLILDPAVPRAKLEAALLGKLMWQRYVKRGTKSSLMQKAAFELVVVRRASPMSPRETQSAKLLSYAPLNSTIPSYIPALKEKEQDDGKADASRIL